MLSERKRKLMCCWLANFQCTRPILQNVSLCDRNCNLQTIKGRYCPKYFLLHYTKEYFKRRGKNTWNFVSPCSHQGEQCSWFRWCVARGSNYKQYYNFWLSDFCGEHHAMLKLWYQRPCVVDSASNSVFTAVTGYGHYGAFGCQHFTTSLIFNLELS